MTDERTERRRLSVGVVVTGTLNYTVQYTYDNISNLPSGVSFPQVFNHGTLVALTATADGTLPVGALQNWPGK